MACCPSHIVTFAGQASTTVSYSNAVQVDVMYLQDDVWTQAGVFTRIEITPTSVFVDHGGIANGVIKITGSTITT